MTERKRISLETEKRVLLQSRRRCCLCFWLEGVDEAVRGQIAHLDQDPSNNKFENLAFLCFDHHDEYDGRTSVSKSLQQGEVAQWRDELYKEMEYRFRSVKSRKLELGISRFLMVNRTESFKLEFRLRNIGQAAVQNVCVSIRLPDNVTAEPPRAPPEEIDSGPFGLTVRVPRFDMPDPFGFCEVREDFFEPNGRIASVDPLPRINPVLLPDHSCVFEGLGLQMAHYPDGTELRLDYRIDAEEMEPYRGTITGTVPSGLEWILEQKEEFGLPANFTLEDLERVQQQSADERGAN